DSKGVTHDWRAELTAALARRQESNGSWVNKADRFLEGDPNLVTAYGLLALAYARPKSCGENDRPVLVLVGGVEAAVFRGKARHSMAQHVDGFQQCLAGVLGRFLGLRPGFFAWP